MKVMYIVPNWKKHDIKYTTVSLNIPNSIPLEYMYVESLLNSEIESKILDANMLGLESEAIVDIITEYEANVIIFNTTINYILWRCPPVDFEVPQRLMEICRAFPITTIAIGPHSSVEPKEVYEKLGVDYLIVGEPEIALSRFLNSDLLDKTIKGLYGKGIDNGIAEEVSIETLPIPNFTNINLMSYDIHAWSSSTRRSYELQNIKGTILEYSRGCVFHCPFCFRKGFRDKYRKKSVFQIEAEIVEVKKKGIKYIYFIDEIFNIENDEWKKLIAILKREEMLFGCQARPDTMSYEMIDTLKDSGCVYIEYGVESFSEEVLYAIGKNLDKNKLLRILAYSYHVFEKENVELGMINFYIDDIKKILNLNDIGKWNAKVLRPYPNSLIGNSLYRMYNVTNNKWEFLLRYIWWSQIENYENFFNIESDIATKDVILNGDFKLSQEKSYNLLELYITEIRRMKCNGKI